MMLERPSPGRSTRAESLRRLRDARYRQRLKAGPVVVPVTIGPSSSTGWFGFDWLTAAEADQGDARVIGQAIAAGLASSAKVDPCGGLLSTETRCFARSQGSLRLCAEVVRAVQHDGGQLRSFQILGRKRARHLFSESRFHALSVIDGNLIGESVETFRGCFPKRAAGVDLADWSGCERKRDTAERRDVALARRAVVAGRRRVARPRIGRAAAITASSSAFVRRRGGMERSSGCMVCGAAHMLRLPFRCLKLFGPR